MTPSPVHRAAERTERTAESPAVSYEADTTVNAAALPVPVPAEPEPLQMPVIPAPDVAPPDPDQPESERPRHPPSRFEGVVLNHESFEEFSSFVENLEDHYMPFNHEERVFVGKLAEARWFSRRRKKVFESIESALFAAQPDTSKWGEAEFRRLAVADSYRIQGEIAAQRAQEKVEEFMLRRISEYQYETDRDLAVRRLEVQKRRCDVLARSRQASGKPATQKAVAN